MPSARVPMRAGPPEAATSCTRSSACGTMRAPCQGKMQAHSAMRHHAGTMQAACRGKMPAHAAMRSNAGTILAACRGKMPAYAAMQHHTGAMKGACRCKRPVHAAVQHHAGTMPWGTMPPVLRRRMAGHAAVAAQYRQRTRCICGGGSGGGGSLVRDVRAMPIKVITVGKGNSKGAALMAEEWMGKVWRNKRGDDNCTGQQQGSRPDGRRVDGQGVWRNQRGTGSCTKIAQLSLRSLSGSGEVLESYLDD
eukprot:363302-Chlamydomonas_euryale.AAC.16